MNDVAFSKIRFDERPTLIFRQPSGTPIGATKCATNVIVDLKYNETSTLEFDLPHMIDGVAVPYYDEIKGMRLVELLDIGQFVLVEPKEVTGTRRYKSCRAYSLEYEFTYKKLSIPKGTYRFYDAGDPKSSVLGMIMALTPSWSVGFVPSAIANKYRTFEVTNENAYNFMKGTAQKTYGCIFEFDTFNRIVHVRDVDETGIEKPVYISAENLAKEIELTENTEDLVTRLDVSGAEGVNIREVNPTGTNKIIDLSYFMTTENFSASLVSKYFSWSSLCEASQTEFKTLSSQYTTFTSKKITLEAELRDLRGEMTSLENQQAVIIQAIAQNLKEQSDLEDINISLAAKQAEINSKNAEITTITSELEDMLGRMKAIQKQCAFESYFSLDEQRQMDKYIRDGEVSDSSFVVAASGGYADSGNGEKLDGESIILTDISVNSTSTALGTDIYSIRGGNIEVGSTIKAAMVSCTIDVSSDRSVTLSAYLNNGTLLGNSFPGANISVIGRASYVSDSASAMTIQMQSGYYYFTFESTQQEKQSVSQELYEFGKGVLAKICRPSYTFSVSSANFLAIDDFIQFKNQLALGEKLYVKIGDSNVLRPFCTEVRFNYDDVKTLDLKFSDTYVAGDSTFKLVDLLDQSVSMGKNVDLSRFIYASFEDSGAKTSIREFMESALDVAKNAIISSTGQAPSMDGAGLRLRKWTDESQTAYEPEQIWMNNNSIVMTDDNWATAEMAIGKFYDENLGECWGIVAPMIVGSIIAGENLIIESAKKDGGIATFRMDADGCRLYNADFAITDGKRQILLNTDYGIAIGKFPLTKEIVDEETGEETGRFEFIEDNANFWVDADGNLHFKGILEAASGKFNGEVIATSLRIVSNGTETDIEDYVSDAVGDKNAELEEAYKELIDEIDGKSTTYYSSTQPSNASSGDIWYDTNNGLIWRYSGTSWVNITSSALKQALDAAGTAQAVADGKIITFAQSTMPTAESIGDLWIDTGNDNRLYRWDGSKWTLCADGRIDSALTKAESAEALANGIYNGETGIYFTSSAVKECLLNNSVGLKITGTDGGYFQATNDAMGFFSSSGSGLMYYEDGNMYLTGTIYAKSGCIGGAPSDAGVWKIASGNIHSGSASTLGSSGGTYIGTNGISIGDAILMKDNGTFIISNGSNEDDNYVLKVEPETVQTETGGSATVYTLALNDVVLKNFVLPLENGGTGAGDRVSAASALGIYRATSKSMLENNTGAYAEAKNGDLCILYSESNITEGSTSSISATIVTSTGSAYPQYLANTIYNTNQAKHEIDYFGISSIRFFNVIGISGESGVSSNYARVGRGSSDTSCALYVPISINTSGTSISSVTLNFRYSTKPSGAYRDMPGEWTSPITVALYRSSGSSSSYGAKLGSTTYMLPTSHQTLSSAVYSTSVVIDLDGGSISSSGDIYYVVFHGRSKKSLLWIDATSVGFGKSEVSTELGIYIKSPGGWSAVSSSDGGTFILSPATTSALGGIIVGEGLSVTSDGVLSVAAGAGAGGVDLSYVSDTSIGGGYLGATASDGTLIKIYSYGVTRPSSGHEGELFFLI